MSTPLAGRPAVAGDRIEPTATAAACGVVRPHALQVRALGRLREHLATGGRGVVVMPCGSGKTLLGRWLAEDLGARLVVVFVPSLALVGQTLMAYRSLRSWRHTSMVVCSDPTTGRAVAVDDLDLPGWARQAVTASTSPRRVAEFLGGPGVRLVVSTYHSAPRVAAALQATGRVVDLVVCDEAHRLTGRPRAEFRAVLDEDALPARRRVFLTATPVEAAAWRTDGGDVEESGVLFLDDAATFGPTVYRASFAEAVDQQLVVDYDVQVLAERAEGAGSVPSPSAGPAQAVLAAAAEGATRILSFHSRVSHARALARALDATVLPDGRVVRAEYLESRHRGDRRRAALARLGAPGPGEVRVLASARVLTEGVDVPAVDTVVFAEPRTSPVDIVQAVGRAMRASPGKTRGRIVLPVTLDHPCAGGLDVDTALGATAWRQVWVVLRALAAMDPRFAATLAQATRRNPWPAGSRPHAGPGLHLALPADLPADRWALRALDRTGAGWWHNVDLLRGWAAEHGHARPGGAVQRGGVVLGSWVARQRTLHRAGLLDPDRVTALEALPGWAWTDSDTAWWHGATQWLAYHQRSDRARDRAQRWAQLARQPAHQTKPTPRRAYDNLADFAADTCARHRRGDLPRHLARAAERLPEWTWQLLDADDATMVDALAEYAAWKQDFNPDHDYSHDDDLPLGAWVTALRRRRLTAGLDPALARELTLAQRQHRRAARLRWEHDATAWRLGYLALVQYTAREGRTRIPYHHREALPDHDLDLSRWCVVQRHDYRRGVIRPERVHALEQIPGWAWEVELREGYRPQLPDSDHGSRSAYARGCRCEACTDANRGYENQRRARRARGQPATDLVDAARARGHLRILLGRGATQTGLARAARLNVKTIVEVDNGTLARVRPETETAILALTPAAERAAVLPGALVDAAPTWALLDDLITRGWPKAWIARQLGQPNAISLQINRDRVHAATAVAVAELHQRLAGRRPPPQRRRLPPLAHILATDAGLAEQGESA